MWSPPQRRHRFTKADRIRATREFRAVIRGGEKVSSKNLSLFIRRHPGPGRRLGLAIAGRLGGAVSRNRIKRRLREYIRLHRDRMAQGLDLVIVAHRDLSEVDPETFQAIVGDLFKQAGLFQDLSPEHAEEFVQSGN